ncbi:hypothetical protein [uncultured Kriegella sp.]|uniref:hypothetical protein n=1 Tax=uncultured Kriegella sp. TaxID=1798910 RepID=UPI0030D9B3D6|tara:strand:+ start:17855 stop:18013 length:159 start_codon:yes stop_codon:yes gene_type:complete
MKKFLIAGSLVIGLFGMSSCNYDDSEDIDLLIPKDDTQETTGALFDDQAKNP